MISLGYNLVKLELRQNRSSLFSGSSKPKSANQILCAVPVHSDTTVVQRNLEPIRKIKMQLYVSLPFLPSPQCDVCIFFPEIWPKRDEWQNVEIKGKWGLCINENKVFELLHMR